MAKYDRDFLVPYLQDICSLHLADHAVSMKIYEIQEKILHLKAGREIESPDKPEKEEAWDFLSVLCAGAGVFLMASVPILGLGILTGGFHGNQIGFCIFLTIVCAPLGWFLWRQFGTPAVETSRINKAREEQYREELRYYYAAKKEIEIANAEARKKIPELENKISFYVEERKKIATLLDKAYGVNVFPSQYRNTYAAVYLYEYFRNSRSDDLDVVLNTYVLEQVKDKLDQIIFNQEKTILNQRMIMVTQQYALEEQRAHSEYMRRKACQIATNIEEQKQYLSMVESNTAATAYFFTASYLR